MFRYQARRVGEMLAKRRMELGLSAAEVGRRANVDKATVTRIESGQIPNPRPDTLAAIAKIVGIEPAEVFAVAKWFSGQQSNLRPYLRTKYSELPDAAFTEMEAEIERIARAHGFQGPLDNEDEAPVSK